MNSNTISTTTTTTTSINNNNNSNINNNNSNNFFSKSKFLAGLTNGETISNVLSPLRYSNKANINMNKNPNKTVNINNNNNNNNDNNINEQIITESCIYADPHSYGSYNFIPNAPKNTYSNFEEQLANKSFEIRSNNETNNHSYNEDNMEGNDNNYIYNNNDNTNNMDRSINSRTSSVYNQLLKEYENENNNNNSIGENENCEMSFYPNDDIESDNLSYNDINHIRPKNDNEFNNNNEENNIGYDSENEFHGFSGVIDDEILEGTIEFINKDSNDYFPSTFASTTDNDNNDNNENDENDERQEYFMSNDNKNYSEKINTDSSCRSISSISVNFEDFEDFDYKKFDKDHLSIKKNIIGSNVNTSTVNDNNIDISLYMNQDYNDNKFINIETNNTSSEINNEIDETISSFHDAFSQFQNDSILKDINGNDNIINERLGQNCAMDSNNNDINNNNVDEHILMDSESNTLKHLLEENLHIHSFLKSIKNLNPCTTYSNIN
ncbi:unnamed protein product [[Candida] boidinii]|nr:unnamed protein product [[Candida] boidinii]